MLALVPLRGWAHVQMHGLPMQGPQHPEVPSLHAAAPDVPLVDEAASPHATCHGSQTEVPGDRSSVAACAMCDLCHGAAPGTWAGMAQSAYSPPRVAGGSPAAGERPPHWFFRPPRS